MMNERSLLKIEVTLQTYVFVCPYVFAFLSYKQLPAIAVPLLLFKNLSIYIPWPFPPVSGVADNIKEQQKQWGPHSVPLAMTRDPAEFGWHCWSTTAHPPPSSTTYVASQMPSPLLPLPQGCPYKVTPWQRQMPIRTASQSFATHSYS